MIDDKFRILLLRGGGGIFTPKTRKGLLGILGQAGRARTRNQFWYKVRNRVRTALTDLQLFIEVTGKNNVNQVVTQETLAPVVKALLSFKEGPDLKRAEIARLFIRTGFNYLKSKEKDITLSHHRTTEEALDLTDFLVESFKPESKRQYHPRPYS